MTDTAFKAPWSTTLIVITAIACTILLGVVLIGLLTGSRNDILWLGSMVGLPLAILVGTAFFCVRGYRLVGNTLYVQRLGWTSSIALTDLEHAEADPQAMDGSLRLFGIGGLFSFTGIYRNRRLGTYQAYCTDLRRAVVLRFPRRTVVVTPEDPERFLAALQTRQQV